MTTYFEAIFCFITNLCGWKRLKSGGWEIQADTGGRRFGLCHSLSGWENLPGEFCWYGLVFLFIVCFCFASSLSCCCMFCLCIFVVRWWFLCIRLLCRAPFICKWATLFLETQMEFHSQKYAIFLQMGDLIFSYTNILLQNMQILADGRPWL